MNTYQQPLWGYEIELPEGWIHQTIWETEGFARQPEALQPDYDGENLGHLLIRGEWNWSRQPIEPLWNQHITKLSVMLGAKKLGAAPWSLGVGQGFEAEILLPKKTNKRLWIGILAYDVAILHFMVTHWKEERAQFEPVVTQIIQSLRFVEQVKNVISNEFGCPIPPNYAATDPKNFLNDIQDAAPWQAYDGQASVGALQAFYLRELPVHGWEIEEYVPYPAQTNLGFARFKVQKKGQSLMVGILPIGEKEKTGKIVIKT
jgi:hypothetical protein